MVDVTKYTYSQGVQTNADDLVAAPRTVVVTAVTETGDAKQPIAVSYDGDGGKPFIPCLTMRKLIAALWGGESDNWIGKSMTLFRDPSIKFGPDTPGGVRISHMSGIEKTVSVQLLEKRGKRRQYTIVPLEVTTPVPKPKPAPKQPDNPPPVDRAELQRQSDAAKSMTPEDKKAWWDGLTADEKAVVKELASVTA